MALFQGAGVAIITPMKKNLEVNFDKLEEIIMEQIENKTDSIIITGTTGEASTLTMEEHLECIRVAAAAAKKRVPVIAGTGSNCTATAIELSGEAEKAGADGLLVVTPYYNKATQNGLLNHFKKIAAAVDIPIVLYNIPGRTGCSMTPATIAKLFKEIDNIIGLKEATGDICEALRIMHLTDGEIALYAGNDNQIIPLLSIGGLGVISVLSNIAPEFTHDMVMHYLNGNTEEARRMQVKSVPLIDALFSEVNPIPVKAAMNLMGMDVGSLREPLTEMEDINKKILAEAMKDFGLRLV